MNHRKSCEICGIYYSADLQSRCFMSVFPCSGNQEERCRIWLKQAGRKHLLDLPRHKLSRRYVCEKHFTPRDFNKLRNRLRKNAIPTKNLNLPPLDDALLKNWHFPDFGTCAIFCAIS
ncbi:hypothetical protein ABMA28_003491 [Loxostege sticticalis]|uniref:THAP-type domain-containing protein n=1 Tax=Loxostege sticticalis TaxID=481309 RepID=A0ABD0SYX9_LOXSC